MLLLSGGYEPGEQCEGLRTVVGRWTAGVAGETNPNLTFVPAEGEKAALYANKTSHNHHVYCGATSAHGGQL